VLARLVLELVVPPALALELVVPPALVSAQLPQFGASDK
jgi:hypothetical protein